MGRHKFYECIWKIRCFDKNKKLLWEEEHPNILVDQGEKTILDVFFRGKDSLYFLDLVNPKFYIGLHKGTILESTILATIPNEPSGNGYSRLACERSDIGWPTIGQHEGDYRVVSKELSITASGGSIGPINGAFVGTSLDNSGSLIGAVAMIIERTVLAGDTIVFQLRVKMK